MTSKELGLLVTIVSGGRIASKEYETFLGQVSAHYRITKVPPIYYLYSADLASPLGKKTFIDTTWLNEK